MTRPNFWLGIAISHAPECLAKTELRRALCRKLLSVLIFRSSDESRLECPAGHLPSIDVIPIRYVINIIKELQDN